VLEQPPTKATKAIFGGLMAACGAVATVFADGAVTIPEVAIAAGGVVAVVATVFGVTNKPKEI
jgi:hypothetical protein